MGGMNTTPRVDVERFDFFGDCEKECSIDGEYVRHSDYAALLQQLAERDAEVERLGGMRPVPNEGKNNAAHWYTKWKAAERARDEAVGLLRDAERYLGSVLFEPGLRERLAAFLAANGGAT